MRRRCDGGSDPGGGLPLQEGDTGYFFVREDDFVKKSAFFCVFYTNFDDDFCERFWRKMIDCDWKRKYNATIEMNDFERI